jgi:hypothetical protein
VTYKGYASVIVRLEQHLDPAVKEPNKLQHQEMHDLLAFMDALTDPEAKDLSGLIPNAVPSGLPVEDMGIAKSKKRSY